MTYRNIVIKKAVFEIPDSEVQRLNILQGLEADGIKIIGQLYPTLHSSIGTSNIGTYNLEESSPHTFVYFGGNIPVCGNGGMVSITYPYGSLVDATTAGRNVSVYLEQKGITTIDANTNGVGFFLKMLPIMSGWEVWDNTTNKPIKIN